MKCLKLKLSAGKPVSIEPDIHLSHRPPSFRAPSVPFLPFFQPARPGRAPKNLTKLQARPSYRDRAGSGRASNSVGTGALVIGEGIPEVDEDQHWMWVARVLRRSDE